MHRKAVKQLDKLTQWTGERFLKENKTEHSDDFKQFENEIELRKRGVERLYATSIPFHSSLSKRKQSSDPYPTTTSKDKLLSGESLGQVMISYGEELAKSGGGVELGERLEGFGRARCGVACAQDEFTTRLGGIYLTGLETNLNSIKEYESGRKKLESKRLTLDAAMRKLGAGKKDKEIRVLESEVEIAQERYDEIQQDLYSQMIQIQQSETQQLEELTDFLDAELDFVARYQEILSDLKGEWMRGGPPSSTTRPRSKSTSAVTRTIPSRAVPPHSRSTTQPSLPSRAAAARKAASSSDEDRIANAAQSRARSHSNASAGSTGRSRLDLASIVPSFGKKSGSRFTGANKQKYGSLKDDETGLRVDEDERYTGEVSTEEESYPGDRELRTPTKATRAGTYDGESTPHPHIVKVIYPYQAILHDELSLNIGDIIRVTRDVSPDWWIGQNMDGDLGLFPSSYTLPHHQTNGSVSPPPQPAIARTRTLPTTATGPVSSSRSLAPPIVRSSSQSPSQVTDLSASTDDEDEEDYPEQRTARPMPSPSPMKKNKPPPPPVRRSTASSSSNNISSMANASSPAKPATFEPPVGGSRMVMPGRTPPPIKRAHSSAATSASKSPFGGSEDDERLISKRGATVPDCGVCGCDDFTQNVFKAAGTCSSCFHTH